MMMGVYLHGAIPYMHARPTWPINEAAKSTFFDVTVAVIHGFRMQLFFVLAGFFARLVAERRGIAGLLRNRATRIAVPFLAGMMTLVPVTLGVWAWAARSTGAQLSRPDPSPGFLAMPTVHLWFLEYLLVYYAAVGGLLWLNGDRERSWTGHRLQRLPTGPWLALPLALITFGLLSGGPAVGEVEEAGIQLLPGLRGLVYYGCYFAFGWILHRLRAALDVLSRHRASNLVVAVIAFAAYGVCADRQYRRGEDGPLPLWFGNLSAEVFTWSMTLLTIGVAVKSFVRPRAWARYLADASYWFYLAHLPLVIVLQAWVVDLNTGAAVKCGVVVAVTTLLLWGSYQWGVRHTCIGRILNGPRGS